MLPQQAVVETARGVLGGNPTRSLTSQTSKYHRNKKKNNAVNKDEAEAEFTPWLQQSVQTPPPV
jgi:hypothetical protein